MNGLFGVNGLLGYFVAVVLLLSVVFGLGYAAVVTQKAQANNPYVIEDANALQMSSKANAQHFKDAPKGE
ncbi:DUF4006 family protein [Helicobacter winghamensis]|uniref:DUF4006 family protein n=1 Tax=Helicobacter winghamensis TaxID=157268 RepID=A0A2N3PJ69_9HELI|nr:DUF4006 family protein [Helicobacter winghamensis]EEO25430.1 hypothetical protein HWAG_00222 [Helicobacter winghamensis ATCC BAA-430]PKT78139.1 hypothetical protein BCM34_02730 [Helicobacter winghamensis]PKT78408.1 hypothetical protein BCM32_01500 [Helicobacter winghamensis]PKT78668.1 hypothetical protein BCM35_01020 [Helicobacter winghamensis]PKT80439.1 hypothetical protein BCM33_07920 [Helicobacter winghamensis]